MPRTVMIWGAIMRILLLVVAMLVAPIAHAQQWPANMPSALSRSGAPTIFEGADGEIFVAEGQARHGDVLAAFPIRYAQVGRLKNDVHRFDFWTNAPIVYLRAGTVVFRTQFIYMDAPIAKRADGPAHWCGVALDGKTQRAYCWQEGKNVEPGKVHLGYARSNFPVQVPVGAGITDGHRASQPEIDFDETARAELPAMEFVYVLNKTDYCQDFVRGGIRVDGRILIVYPLDYGCSRGKGKGDYYRSMSFAAGDGVMCVYGVGDDGAMVSVTKPPTSYLHPHERDVLADRSAELRALGEAGVKLPDAPQCPPQRNNP
jgi:hypothetical protein